MCIQTLIRPRKELTETAPSTTRKKVKKALDYTKTQSGSTSESLNKCHAILLKRSTKADRESILSEIGLRGEMTDEEGLAMVADLNLTWYTYRAWGR